MTKRFPQRDRYETTEEYEQAVDCYLDAESSYIDAYIDQQREDRLRP